MFCRKCGKVLPEDAAFCRFCGTKIEKTVQQEKAPPVTTTDPPSSADQGSGQKDGRPKATHDIGTITSYEQFLSTYAG